MLTENDYRLHTSDEHPVEFRSGDIAVWLDTSNRIGLHSTSGDQELRPTDTPHLIESLELARIFQQARQRLGDTAPFMLKVSDDGLLVCEVWFKLHAFAHLTASFIVWGDGRATLRTAVEWLAPRMGFGDHWIERVTITSVESIGLAALAMAAQETGATTPF